jgi:acyl-CoA synthetase (NDP forming)
VRAPRPSHTGALASSDAIVEALFRQAGVIRTYTLEEMFDVAAMLAHQPIPAGRRVAILTNAGGPGILAADACEANGLELPQLSAPRVTRCRRSCRLRRVSAIRSTCWRRRRPITIEQATRLVLADANVDSLLVIFIPPLVTNPKEVAEAIVRGAAARPQNRFSPPS